ncbi:MAG TPA: 4'-phosphopantetheinyl transferase superfamily protein [Candidatus Acidoferrales bacterium]|nr:4'-phosphopantetheinyl transferase superfamily protein [Candidatus Acidoferrales bacterium]
MPELGISAVHVWHSALELPPVQLQRLETLLSRDEQQRAARFALAAPRAAFVAARGILRQLLAGYLGVDPRRLRFCYERRGKPALDPSLGSDLTFNVSHSHGVALFAVGRGRRLGIDVEHIRAGRDSAKIAQRFFSPSEAAALDALPAALRRRAFYACWTRKEAFVKAMGTGITHPLDSFEVSVAPDEPATLVHIDGDRRRALDWRLRDLHFDRDYAAALAVEGHDWQLSCHERHPEA